jgi:hypothetical protein
VLLWGGDDATLPAKVDFGPYFSNGGNMDPNWVDFVPPAGVPRAKYTVPADVSAIPSLHGALLVGGLIRGTCDSTTATPYFGGVDWNPVVANLQSPRVNHTVTPILDGGSLVAIGGATETDPCVRISLNSIETLAVVELGGSCTQDGQCVTGHCVDHVCCENACPHDGPTACQGCAPAGRCQVREAGAACTAPNGCGSTCDGVQLGCPESDAGPCAAGADAAADATVDATVDGSTDASIDTGATPTGTDAEASKKISFLSADCSASAVRGVPGRAPVFVSGIALLLIRRLRSRRARPGGPR